MAFANSSTGKLAIQWAAAFPWTEHLAMKLETAREVDRLATEPLNLTAAEDGIKRGMLVGYSTGWKRALATTGTAIQGKFVALEDADDTETFKAAPMAIVSGFTGATPGAQLYAAEGTSNGMLTETAPTTSGDCNKIVGVAISATTGLLCPNQNADTTA